MARQPLTVPTPSNATSYKYFNHCNWTGLNQNKNQLTVDINSLADVNNVYIDKNGLLRSRPSIKYREEYDYYSNVKQLWDYGKYKVKHDVDDIGQHMVTVIENGIAYSLFVNENFKLLPFDEKLIVFDGKNSKYYENGEFHNLNDILYKPLRKYSFNGNAAVTDENYTIEEENLLTTGKKEIHQWDSLSGVSFDYFEADTAELKIGDDEYNIEVTPYINNVIVSRTAKILSHCRDANGNLLLDVKSDAALLCQRVYDGSSYEEGAYNLWYKDNIKDARSFRPLGTVRNLVNTPVLSEDGQYVLGIEHADSNNELLPYQEIIYEGNANRNVKWEWKRVDSRLSDTPFNKSATVIKTDEVFYFRINNTNQLFINTFSIDLSVYVNGLTSEIETNRKLNVKLLDNNVCIIYVPIIDNNAKYVSLLPIFYDLSDCEYKIDDAIIGNTFEQIDTIFIRDTEYVIQYRDYLSDSYKIDYHKGNGEVVTLFDGLDTKHYLVSYDNVGKVLKHMTETYYTDDGDKVNGAYYINDIEVNYLHNDVEIVYANDGTWLYLADDYLYVNDLYVNDLLTDNSLLTLTLFVNGEIKPFNFTYSAILNVPFFAEGNKLYYASGRADENANLLLYIPKLNVETFDNEITNLYPLSKSELGIFFENQIWYTFYDTSLELPAQRFFKTKILYGCKKGCDVTATIDGSSILFVSAFGLMAMSYQQNVAVSEQTVRSITDNIYTTFRRFAKGVKFCNYENWLICINEEGKGLLFDYRTGSWWPMESDVIKAEQILMYDDKLTLLYDGELYEFSTSAKDYFDGGLLENRINWKLQSQPLSFDAVNNYKHVHSIIFDTVLDEEVNINSELIVEITDYRQGTELPIAQNLSFTVDMTKLHVKRLNHFKVRKCQYTLRSETDSIYSLPLSMTNITLKYSIKGEVK